MEKTGIEEDAFKAFQDMKPELIKRGIVLDIVECWFQAPHSAKTSGERALGLMALNVMCTPAMSTEVECTFSSTKRTLSDARNRMGDDIIESIECLKPLDNEGFALVINGLRITIEEFDNIAKREIF